MFEDSTRNRSVKKSNWLDEWGESIQLAYEYAIIGCRDANLKRSLDATFADILYAVVCDLKFKDEWSVYVGAGNINKIFRGCVVSKKMGLSIEFGLYLDKLYISAPLVFHDRLPFVDDTFWEYVAGLNKYGKSDFKEYSIVSGGNMKIDMSKIISKKSSVFKILRQYLFMTLIDGGVVDLGSVEVVWPVAKNGEELFEKLHCVVYNIYKMNYLLYRSYCQSSSFKKENAL